MEKALLISHASAGLITLITGIIAMLSPKRLKIHRPAGSVFYYAMWYVVLSAFTLAFIKDNVFLFLVGTLTFYTNISGIRALRYYKGTAKSKWPDVLSWTISFLLVSGIESYLLKTYGFRFDGAFVVIHVFSIVLFGNLIQDFNRLRKKSTKTEHLLAHIGKMGGTFIAAITAALVQNIQSDPVWVA